MNRGNQTMVSVDTFVLGRDDRRILRDAPEVDQVQKVCQVREY
jgi:hypothetical protein